MASGDTLASFTVANNDPPSTAPATEAVRNDHRILNFDAATDENAVFSGILPNHYDGGGLTCTVIFMGATATSGNVVWNIAIERHQDDTDDLDTDSFAAANAATIATADVSGEPSYGDITFTNGADMDSLAAGESFRMKVTRDADNASDNMSGDAQLMRIHVQET